jgi:hypothetical protein
VEYNRSILRSIRSFWGGVEQSFMTEMVFDGFFFREADMQRMLQPQKVRLRKEALWWPKFAMVYVLHTYIHTTPMLMVYVLHTYLTIPMLALPFKPNHVPTLGPTTTPSNSNQKSVIPLIIVVIKIIIVSDHVIEATRAKALRIHQ